MIRAGDSLCDAGIIGASGVATREQLDRYAKGWLAWRRDWRVTRAKMLVNEARYRPGVSINELLERGD